MTTTNVLTHQHLIQAGMPAWDVNKFKLTFPDGCEITPENYLKAEKSGMTAHVLFAAVCPTEVLMKEWYRSLRVEDEKQSLRKELDEKIRQIDARSKREELERKCELLRRVLFPNGLGSSRTGGDDYPHYYRSFTGDLFRVTSVNSRPKRLTDGSTGKNPTAIPDESWSDSIFNTEEDLKNSLWGGVSAASREYPSRSSGTGERGEGK